MLTTEELNNLKESRKKIIQNQQSIIILKEYISFLKKLDGQEEIINYLEKSLLQNAIIECHFGREIYSSEDLYNFYKYHKEKIFEEVERFFLGSKNPWLLNKFRIIRNKIWDMMDVSLEIIKSHDLESFEIFQSWLQDANKYLDRAQRSYNFKDYENALKELELSVENLIKAYSLYLGLKKEKDLQTNIGHFSIKVYIDLLNESWITKTKEIFGINTDIKKSVEFLKTLRPPSINPKNIKEEDIEKLRRDLIAWDQSSIIFINYFKIVDNKLNRIFAKKSFNYAINHCKLQFKTDIKAYYKSHFGFSGLLLPLAIITQFYQSKFSYADFTRRLKLDYKELNLIKNFNEIIFLLQENLRYLKDTYANRKEFLHTYLCETLGFKLVDLESFQDDKQKLKFIQELIPIIQNDKFITSLINKIQNSNIIKTINFENFFS